MRYKDQKTTMFSELCSLYESNNSNFYDVLDAMIELMSQEQLEQLEHLVQSRS